MKKQSQIKSNWSQLYQNLKSLPSPFVSKIPPVDKIIFDDAPPSQNPNAIAYVSTEDTDQNGKLDTMHIVVPKLEQELNRTGVDYHSGPNIPLLMALTEVIAHEVGHLSDFKPDQQQPFPGGESVADSAAQQAVRESFPNVASLQNILFQKPATNIYNSLENPGSIVMNNLLIELANSLDGLNYQKQADILDRLINKKAQVEPTSMVEVKPVGDPFTYDYYVQGDYFIVRTAPAEYPKSIGAKIMPGTQAYKRLEKYKPGSYDQEILAPRREHLEHPDVSWVDPSKPQYVTPPLHADDMTTAANKKKMQKSAQEVFSPHGGSYAYEYNAQGDYYIVRRPHGGPYAYEYNAQGDYYIVRKTPVGGEKSLGAKLMPGTKAYEKLKAYQHQAQPSTPQVQPSTPTVQTSPSLMIPLSVKNMLSEMETLLVGKGFPTNDIEEKLSPYTDKASKDKWISGKAGFIRSRDGEAEAQKFINLANNIVTKWTPYNKSASNKNIIKKLANLANQFDEQRKLEYSNFIDELIRKYKNI